MGLQCDDLLRKDEREKKGKLNVTVVDAGKQSRAMGCVEHHRRHACVGGK